MSNTIWKLYLWPSIGCAIIEWILFGLNLIATGYFNQIVFWLAVAWTLFAAYCIFKNERNKKQDKIDD